ncbi:MAG: gfo/Idh/MocA family oxidoreductase [Brevibacillus sp.]|nr:gfo/Idh/MocA family oxidoreductase [Brevibacillus sp.]
MLKVVLVGAEEVESRYQQAWSQLKDVEVVGIIDSLAAFHDLVSKKEVHVVDIASTVESPEPWILAAAKANKHVICEAEWRLGLEAISELATLCEAHGVQLLLANMLRFLPEYTHAHQHVRQGAIGKTGVVRMRRSAPAPSMGKTKGCIFEDLGLEPFDWLRWTFGNVVRVMARRVKHADESGQEIEYALVMLRMEDGSIAHIELSWAEEMERASFELTGDVGMIQYDSHDSQPITLQMNKQRGQGKSGSERFAAFVDVDILQRRREKFIYCLSKQEPFPFSIEDTIQARKIAQAARQSAEWGQPVQLVNGGNS